MKYIKKILFTCVVLTSVGLGVFTNAQGVRTKENGIVPLCGYGRQPDCDFAFLKILASNVVLYMMELGLLLSALMFAYAGWLYLTSQGNADAINKAHGVFRNVVIGLLLMATAWIIVALVFTIMDPKPGFNQFMKTVTFGY